MIHETFTQRAPDAAANHKENAMKAMAHYQRNPLRHLLAMFIAATLLLSACGRADSSKPVAQPSNTTGSVVDATPAPAPTNSEIPTVSTIVPTPTVIESSTIVPIVPTPIVTETTVAPPVVLASQPSAVSTAISRALDMQHGMFQLVERLAATRVKYPI